MQLIDYLSLNERERERERERDAGMFGMIDTGAGTDNHTHRMEKSQINRWKDRSSKQDPQKQENTEKGQPINKGRLRRKCAFLKRVSVLPRLFLRFVFRCVFT